MDELINKYIEYYRKNHPDQPIKNMFEKIDYNDPTSTNHIMEKFYEDMLLHANIDNDIYELIEEINIDDVHELYALNVEGKIIYVSCSVISLLKIVAENNYADWNIINLK